MDETANLSDEMGNILTKWNFIKKNAGNHQPKLAPMKQ